MLGTDCRTDARKTSSQNARLAGSICPRPTPHFLQTATVPSSRPEIFEPKNAQAAYCKHPNSYLYWNFCDPTPERACRSQHRITAPATSSTNCNLLAA